ncbi:pleckstrin homology domain-containing family O member 2 isoform X2 [Pleurodeles waltl]|uniref:pleckstrin homology domain-containing family O member 2 isoform X2 n=1 Tax=Pleurodeles waltl TaxID=8319 RepID=UPI0037096161
MSKGANNSSKKSNKTVDKAGWLKKSSGGLLGYWKDRYIQLCRAQLLIYENEDEQNCLETVDLENYDRCQDLHALLKKKNRFILIRSPGKKVHDVKFQAKNLEEKESWIKAFNEGLNKGKNKVFDEVKVDASCSLEHMTRDRVKMGQGRRRPPTRVHLKEVADGSSDGIMRLDLDEMDNGPQSIIPDTGEKETPLSPKENYKPPVPPLKPKHLSSAEEPLDEVPAETTLESEAPCPPPKVLKERTASKETLEDTGDAETLLRTSQEDLTKDPSKHAIKAPAPPPKVLSDKMKIKWDEPAPEYKSARVSSSLESSKENLFDVDENKVLKPPLPPPKILTGSMKKKEEGLSSSQSSLEVMAQDAEDSWYQRANEQDDSPEKYQKSFPNEETLLIETAKEANGEKVKKEKENKMDDTRPNEISNASKTKPEITVTFLGESQSPSSPAMQDHPFPKARCSSLGDLLSKDSLETRKEGPALLLKKDHLDEMEIRLTSGREKTEMLLQQVLQGDMGKHSEGNGPKASAEALLSEAVQHLRQASQVLQEMKDLEQSQEPDLLMQKDKQKDLLALHRRSMP